MTSVVSRFRRLYPVVLLLAVLTLITSRPGPVGAQAATSKLATVLSDVAAVVQQDAPGTAATAAVPVASTPLPKPAQDALHARTMRMDSTGAGQVTLLMSAVTVDTLQQLTAAGATVQITDQPHLRVQATIPPGRLTAVAALPFVNFVRLPNYARRRTGSVDTEGGAIIKATLARQQYNVDGTGVKVGV